MTLGNSVGPRGLPGRQFRGSGSGVPSERRGHRCGLTGLIQTGPIRAGPIHTGPIHTGARIRTVAAARVGRIQAGR